MGVVKSYPLIYSIWLSFHEIEYKGETLTFQFSGLKNWIYALQDIRMWEALQRTLLFSGLVLSLCFFMSLALALLFYEGGRLTAWLEVLCIIPWAIPAIANGLLWEWILDTNYGILNTLLMKLNIINTPIEWLNNPVMAMLSISIAQIWKDMPFMTLLIFAALHTVPLQLIEASKIDGASYFQRLKNVIIPYIKTSLIVVILLELINTFKVFDLVYALTYGGPYESTQVLSMYAYKQSFLYFNFGYGSTLCYILAIIISLFSFVYLKILGGRLK
ncbi:MAG: sugar ABC transporter permease [Candidatus Methanomethylicaceae archaeon]